MAKVIGFCGSNEAYWRLYQEGIDTYYHRGIPVVRYYAPPQTYTTRRRTISPKKYILQKYFCYYVEAYRNLSPLAKALLRAEARLYNMTAKDLFFFLFLRYLVENKGFAPVFSDMYLYWTGNSVVVDIISSEMNELFLVRFPKFPQPEIKWRRYRGGIEKCPLPISKIPITAYNIPIPTNTPTITITPGLVAQRFSFTGPYYFPYSKDPKEPWPRIVEYVRTQIKKLYGSSPPPAAYFSMSFAHYADRRWYADIRQRFATYYYRFDNIPEYQKIRKLYWDLSNIGYSLSYDQRYFSDPPKYISILFGQYEFLVPLGMKYITFPRIPAGFVPPSRIYFLLRCRLNFCDPNQYLPFLPFGKSISYVETIHNPPVMKAVKGRYFTFRYTIPEPDLEYTNCIAIKASDPKYYFRISPFFVPKTMRNLLKPLPPPDPVQYYFEHDLFNDLRPSDIVPTANFFENIISNERVYNSIQPTPDPTNKRSNIQLFNELYRGFLQNPNWTEDAIFKRLIGK